MEMADSAIKFVHFGHFGGLIKDLRPPRSLPTFEMTRNLERAQQQWLSFQTTGRTYLQKAPYVCWKPR